VANNLSLAELVSMSYRDDLPELPSPTILERERKQS
jgi:hypothetical protein